QVLVQGGRATRVDEDAVYAKAREVTQHYWSRVPSWRWDGATVDQIVPPAFEGAARPRTPAAARGLRVPGPRSGGARGHRDLGRTRLAGPHVLRSRGGHR